MATLAELTDRIRLAAGSGEGLGRTVKLDLKGVQSLPKILAAAKKGDDALLRAVRMEPGGALYLVDGQRFTHDAHRDSLVSVR